MTLAYVNRTKRSHLFDLPRHLFLGAAGRFRLALSDQASISRGNEAEQAEGGPISELYVERSF